MHVREQIRNRYAVLLGALAGGRVYTSRVYPVDVLPAIAIFANSESSTLDPIIQARRLNRTVDVEIEVAHEAVADVDASLDAIASSIETAIDADPTLSGLAVDATLISTTVQLEADGDMPLAYARLVFRTWYRTTAGNPDVAI